MTVTGPPNSGGAIRRKDRNAITLLEGTLHPGIEGRRAGAEITQRCQVLGRKVRIQDHLDRGSWGAAADRAVTNDVVPPTP